MTAPVASIERPRVAVGLGARAPQPSCLRRVRADMERLDARGDAGPPRTRPRSAGSSELDVLDPGHRAEAARQRSRGRRGRPAPRRRRSRGSGCAMPPAAAVVACSASSSAVVTQTPRRCVGRESAVGRRLDVGQQRGGPRPERAVGEHLLPPDPRPAVRVAAEHVAAAQPAGQRRVQRVRSQGGMDAHRQPAGLGQVRVGAERAGRGPGRGRARRGRGARRRRGPGSCRATVAMSASQVGLRRRGKMHRDEPRGATRCRTPVGVAVGRRAG